MASAAGAGPLFDEELLRWIAEAEYLGVSRETALLIATKRRALNIAKSECALAHEAPEKSASSGSNGNQEGVAAPEPGPEGCCGRDSGGPSPERSNQGSRSEGHLCQNELEVSEPEVRGDSVLSQRESPDGQFLKNATSHTSSTQETTTTRFDGLLDQVVSSAIANITVCDEFKRRKRKNKRRKRPSQKPGSYLNALPSQSEALLNPLSAQSRNAQLLRSIVEKDSSAKMALSEDNNSSVDTTMGIVNSGTNQVDRPSRHYSGLDAVVAAHSNNPFNNGRNQNIKVKRKKRYFKRNNVPNPGLSSPSSSKPGSTQTPRLNSSFNDFPEPPKLNLKQQRRNFNRNRRNLGARPGSGFASERTPETCLFPGPIQTPGPSDPKSAPPVFRYQTGSNRRTTNSSERGRLRSKRTEAVEHVREQLMIAFRSRGVTEL
ncbi:putative secreted protein [Cryptosporidium felis]|nr:putative secreted protein [Cryptosporidium felis]